MTLGMVKNVIGLVKGELMFYDGNGVEVINENTCGLEDDAFIQIVDHETGAHYRFLDGEILTLGGEIVPYSFESLLKAEVIYLECPNINTLEIGVRV